MMLTGGAASNPSFQRCTDITRHLYTALVAYYTGFFKTPKSLLLDLDLTRSGISSESKHRLSECFRRIIDHRLDFCKNQAPSRPGAASCRVTNNGFFQDQWLRSSPDSLDAILSDAIAENELKRLMKRKSRKSHGVRESAVMVGIVGEGDDDDEQVAYYHR